MHTWDNSNQHTKRKKTMTKELTAFAKARPYISGGEAGAITRHHRLRLVDFLNDEEGKRDSTDTNINTLDLLAWLGYIQETKA